MSYNQRDLRKVWISYDTEQPEEEIEFHAGRRQKIVHVPRITEVIEAAVVPEETVMSGKASDPRSLILKY